MASTSALFAVSTTFTPPPTCTQDSFTMLARDQYRIWMNIPTPVANSTFADCYPTAYVSSYLSQQTATTVLSPIVPLICPVGYEQVTTISADAYLACCPSGFSLAPPTVSSIGTRPAYGGTCYTDISTVLVTAYDNYSVTATETWTAPPAGGAQAYALPIEGFASIVTTSSSSTSTSTPSPSPTPRTALTSSTASATPTPTPLSSHTNTSAVAGGVVGGVLGLASISALGFLVLFCRRRRNQHAKPAPSEIDSEGNWHGHQDKSAGVGVGVSEMMGTDEVPAYVSEKDASGGGSEGMRVAEMDARPEDPRVMSELEGGPEVSR